MDVPAVCPCCGSPRRAEASGGVDSTVASPSPEVDPQASTIGRPAVPGEHPVWTDSLAASLASARRVVLRDTDDLVGAPVVRPSSGPMPMPAGFSGRLELLGEIAHGGMGSVLKGHDASLGRDLAVKVLLDKHMDRPELILRFVEEAQIAGQLQHPGIVPVYELGTFTDRRPFFSMKLVKGRTLADLLRDRPSASTDLSRFLSIFESICQTMAYAHARGVIHRDLKPSNVMLGSFGEVQVMDWGLAKVIGRGGDAEEVVATTLAEQQTIIATIRSGTDSDLSQAGSVMGTPAYMAPEQAAGEVDRVNERADVFALGSMLCEILTGQPAFAARTTGELRKKAALADMSDAFVRLNACSADTALVTLAKHCLEIEPENRPAGAGAVAERMTTYLATVQERLRQTELARVTAETRAATERTRRRLTLALAASVLGLFALGGGGWAYLDRQRTERREDTAQAIHERIDRAAVVEGKAAAARIGDLTGWTEALSEIKGAEDLLKHGEHDEELAERVKEVRAELERGKADATRRAREAEADQRLVEQLETVRTDRGEHWDPARTDREFAEAFRDYGVDMETTEPKKAGTLMAGRTASVEIAAALDEWYAIRRYDLAGHPKSPPWEGLVEAVRVTDPDPWRNALRAQYGRPPTEGVGILKERAADPAVLEQQPAASLVLLARMLNRAGAEKESADVLRAAWRRFPGDFWVNHTLGSLSWSEAGGGGYRRPDEAARYLMAVVVIRPDSARGHTNLGAALHDKGDLDGAIAEQREAIRLQPDNAGAHTNLGEVLRLKGQLDEAIAAHREALRLEPGIAEVHTNLGHALSDKGDHEGAIAELREALRLKPNLAIAHNILGQVLRHLGDDDGAVVEYREALQHQPDLAAAHENLGKVSLAKGDLDSAINHFRDAVRFKPDNANFHVSLSDALSRKGDFDGAVVAGREALQLQHNDASAHAALARALSGKGYQVGAINEFREALRHHPDDPSAHIQLGEVLWMNGNYNQAVDQFQQAIALTGPDTERLFPGLTKTIARVEREAALAQRLPAVISGADRPKTAADALDLANVAKAKSLFAAAAQLSADALAAEPERADDLKSAQRYKSASLAVLASQGIGKDNPAPDPSTRTRFRSQALAWLKADLAVHAKRLEGATPETRKEVAETLAHWQRDPDLAGIRDEAGLAELPKDDRKAWKALWTDVDSLREQARGEGS